MQQLKDLQILFNEYLEQNTFRQSPRELYVPVNYILKMGGKRLRPVLVLAACKLFGKKAEAALPPALAIEIFHNFSLVHDDIMDEAPLRRGEATVHMRFGTNAGILSGDVMLIYSYHFLLKMKEPAMVSRLVEVFNRIAIMVCEGQQYDVNFEKRLDVSIPEYIKMIEYKTAALIAGGLKMGAIVGGAGEDDQERLYAFGRNIGIAFQLQDDYLDTFGDPKKFGKKPGGDIVQNKKTFLILKALELASDRQREILLHEMTRPEPDEVEKIKMITGILYDLGVPALAQAEKQKYRKKAFDQLEAVKVPAAQKKILVDLADSLVTRQV